MITAQCGTCRHFLFVGSSPIGACKRYPPMPLGSDGQAVPQVSPADWCGEFSVGQPRHFPTSTLLPDGQAQGL